MYVLYSAFDMGNNVPDNKTENQLECSNLYSIIKRFIEKHGPDRFHDK